MHKIIWKWPQTNRKIDKLMFNDPIDVENFY